MKANSLISIFLCCVLTILVPTGTAKSRSSGQWELTRLEAVNDNPQLIHKKWDLLRPPFGELDTISLHKVSKKRKVFSEGQRVILFLPGTWQAGRWTSISDPQVNTMLFLANAGLDVYVMDSRTQNIPDLDYHRFEEKQVNIFPTTNWTYAVFREDIKAAVEKIKKSSRTEKIFLAGFSRGGIQMFIYANKYQNDLLGLISLDGGLKDDIPNGTPLEEAGYNSMIELFKNNLMIDPNTQKPLPWVYGLIDIDNATYASFQLAKVMPHSTFMAADQLPDEFEELADFVADKAHQLIIPGLFTNYYDDMIDRDVLVTAITDFDRYSPHRQTLEELQMMAWDNVPYLDYDDQRTSLPVIAFFSPFMCPANTCLLDSLPNRTTSDDVTVHLLENYGHLDILYGKDSYQDIKLPLLSWLNDHAHTE